jgi:hypothetical protein
MMRSKIWISSSISKTLFDTLKLCVEFLDCLTTLIRFGDWLSTKIDMEINLIFVTFWVRIDDQIVFEFFFKLLQVQF